MHVCACICMVAAGLVRADKHAPLSKLPGRFLFAPTRATAAKATKATKRRQGGRRHKQPASNLFLRSTVKIPAECSYLFQSITTQPWRKWERKSQRLTVAICTCSQEGPLHSYTLHLSINGSIKYSHSEVSG